MAVAHQPCSDCGSSDALLINDDGSTKCFSCGTYHSPESECPTQEKKVLLPTDFIKGIAKGIDDRHLSKSICQKFKYNCADYKGEEVQIATYRDLSGQPKFQKIRYSNRKEFFIKGQFEPLLFGMHLFSGNDKKIIITEGEIDCLSIAEINKGSPVVSVPNGANNAAAAIKHNLEWLERFEEVIICFDMDKVGQEAAKECAALLSVGKAKIMSLPLKDPNDMLKNGRSDELYKAIWNAVEYRPDGIVSGVELWEEIEKPINYGLGYPFETMTKLTYGIRPAEMIVFGAGTGMGKTSLFKEIETNLIVKHSQNVGIIHLEEQTREILNGDIHTKNQKMAGLQTRAEAKRFIYAFNYGGGDELIGSIVGGTAADGKKIKQKFLKGLPKLKNLIDRVKLKIKTHGYLLGIDKRALKVREQYKGLNVLLQSAGAIVMKKALCILVDDIETKGWKLNDDVAFVLNVHDEYQAEVKPELVEEYKVMAVNAIKKAGEYFGFRCPLDGEAKVGNSWYDTH